MASTTFAKSVYFLAGTSALLGAGYVAKPWILGDKVSDLISYHDKDKKLLTSATPNYSERWMNAWFNYRRANKGTNAWNIPDLAKEFVDKKDIPAPTSFVDACENKGNESVTGVNDPLYKQVLDWCTGKAKVSIKDLIKDTGRRSLGDHDSKEDDSYGWKPLWKTYVKTNAGKSSDELGLEGWTISVKDTDEAMMNKFIDQCKSLSKEEVDSTLDLSYQKVNAHCASDIHAEDIIRDSYSDKRLINLNQIKQDDQSPLATTIWNRYIRNNKSKPKGTDEWKIKDFNIESQKAPKDFWDNCEKQRKAKVKGIQDVAFKQVFEYCVIENTPSNKNFLENP